jgi:Sporulation and spore germination
MQRLRFAALTLALAGLGGMAVPAATATASTTVPTLTAIRAAHHPGYDRLVFEFQGPLPAARTARYVTQVIGDPSGLPVPVVGSARLLVQFHSAAGHNASGGVTYGPAQRTYSLPNVIQVINAGDFESYLSFGVGLARKEPIHVFTLTKPSRVVIDIQTPYGTVNVRDYFLDSNAFATGHQPYTRAVTRPVIPPATAFGALQRLFAGPTQAERAQGLRFVASQATGFTKLSISSDGVARVQLTGGCSSGGSTFTIANEIMPTLKQFPSVHWVKIYDPSGHTERPTGHTDSIPVSLEP